MRWRFNSEEIQFADKAVQMKGRLRIDVIFDCETTSRIDSTSLRNIDRRDIKQRRIFKESTSYRVRTGKPAKAGLSDLAIRVNLDYLENEAWLDPKSFQRVDAVSILMHEIFRALGFNGFRNLKTGLLADEFHRVFDQYFEVQDGRFLFKGPQTVRLLGEPLQLTSTSDTQNLFHHGNEKESCQSLIIGVGFVN